MTFIEGMKCIHGNGNIFNKKNTDNHPGDRELPFVESCCDFAVMVHSADAAAEANVSINIV